MSPIKTPPTAASDEYKKFKKEKRCLLSLSSFHQLVPCKHGKRKIENAIRGESLRRRRREKVSPIAIPLPPTASSHKYNKTGKIENPAAASYRYKKFKKEKMCLLLLSMQYGGKV